MALFSGIAYLASMAVSYLAAAAGLSTLTALSLGFKAGVLAAGIAGQVALTAIGRLLAPKPSVDRSEIQAVLNQTDAFRRVFVGQNLTGGVRALYDVRGGILYQLVVVAHGRIDGFVRFWIDGVPHALGSGSDWWGSPQAVQFPASGDKHGYVNVATHDGSGNGGAYPVLSRFPYWGAARRLTGQATFLVGCLAPNGEDFTKVFPKASGTGFQWEIRGQQVWDPRINASVYSDNAALVTAHYMRHPEGMKLAFSDVNWDSVAAMADVADLPVLQQDGSILPSLRLWGYWTLNEEPSSVLDRFAASSGIRAYEMESGQMGLIGGPYGEPACTITAKSVREIETREAISEREGFNVLQVFFMSHLHNYEMIEADPWRDEDRLLVEGEIPEEARLEMCPGISQGRRRGKQIMHDSNRAKVEAITDLVGLKARYPKRHGQRHTILLNYRPDDGSDRIVQGEYEVLDHEFDPVAMECRLELGTVDRRCQEFTPFEEGRLQELPIEIAGDAAPALDAFASVRIEGGQAFLHLDGNRDPARRDLALLGRYRNVDATSWIDMRSQAESFTADSAAVEDGATFQIEGKLLGIFSGVAPWVPLATITVRVNGTAPVAASSLSVTKAGSRATVKWRNPPANFTRAFVYRAASTATVFDAVLLGSAGGTAGQFSDYEDATSVVGQSYRYWVRCENQSRVSGPYSAPASITI